MKTTNTLADYKKAHVIEQLEKLGSHNNEHYTYDELVRKLTVARDMEPKKCIECKKNKARHWDSNFCEKCFADALNYSDNSC